MAEEINKENNSVVDFSGRYLNNNNIILFITFIKIET